MEALITTARTTADTITAAPTIQDHLTTAAPPTVTASSNKRREMFERNHQFGMAPIAEGYAESRCSHSHHTDGHHPQEDNRRALVSYNQNEARSQMSRHSHRSSHRHMGHDMNMNDRAQMSAAEQNSRLWNEQMQPHSRRRSRSRESHRSAGPNFRRSDDWAVQPYQQPPSSHMSQPSSANAGFRNQGFTYNSGVDPTAFRDGDHVVTEGSMHVEESPGEGTRLHHDQKMTMHFGKDKEKGGPGWGGNRR